MPACKTARGGKFSAAAVRWRQAADRDRRLGLHLALAWHRLHRSAPLPAPYERSKVTCDWLAWFVYQKFWLLTPLDRIPRDLAERGIPLAMSTLVSFIERAADLLSGVDGLHWKQLLASSWMATDGTGIKVIVPKLPAAHNGDVELYRNDELAVFHYEPTKDGDVVPPPSFARFAASSLPTPNTASMMAFA